MGGGVCIFCVLLLFHLFRLHIQYIFYWINILEPSASFIYFVKRQSHAKHHEIGMNEEVEFVFIISLWWTGVRYIFGLCESVQLVRVTCHCDHAHTLPIGKNFCSFLFSADGNWRKWTSDTQKKEILRTNTFSRWIAF